MADESTLRVVAVDTARGRFHGRVYAVLRTWALVQLGRAHRRAPRAAVEPEAEDDRRSTEDALVVRLLSCPVEHVVGRVLRFAFA